jgi:SAM-dependent methyltransferase
MVNDERFLERFSFRDQYLATRSGKAEKIIAVLREEGVRCEDSVLLDIGCSRGHITYRMAQVFKSVIGIDLNNEEWKVSSSLQFIQADACRLPLATGLFDVVLMNHTIEHVSSPQLLMKEVWRVLRYEGVCYLACPNRWTLVEPHYRLPFLSWLPRSMADRYVRLARRGESYLDRMPSYWKLKELTRPFQLKDFTAAILKAPELYLRGDPQLMRKIKHIHWLPFWLLKFLTPLMPGWILVLKKE